MRTDHLLPCVIDPIPSCLIWGGIFSGIDAMQGARLSIRTYGLYAGGLWVYHASICPMEVIHGRRSSLHNVVAGASFGYIGVSRGVLGVPFMNPYQLMAFRNPALIGAAVYGVLAGGLATLGGKSI